MDALISYFSDLEKRPLERAGFFIAGMVILWIIENAIPLLQTDYKKSKGRHAATNIAFTAIHFVIHTLLAGGIVFIAGWTNEHQFGLVYWFNLSPLALIIATCLVLDFLQDGFVILWNTRCRFFGVFTSSTMQTTMWM